MKKLNLLIDMDNTIVDFTSAFLSRYNKITGENISNNQVVHYSFDTFLDRNICRRILGEGGLFLELLPYPDAISYLFALKDVADISIVTQPSPENPERSVEEKYKWLKEYLPFLSTKSVIFASKKYLVSGDILFDDSPKHLNAWPKHNPESITCKIRHPYNRDTETDFSFDMEYAWENFYNLVIDFSRGNQ